MTANHTAMLYIGEGKLHLGQRPKEDNEKPVLDVFFMSNLDNEKPWQYSVIGEHTEAKNHLGFATKEEAIADAIKVYKVKHMVRITVMVELENPHMDLQELTDMISGRAATIQGVNAMKADGELDEHWFEAEDREQSQA